MELSEFESLAISVFTLSMVLLTSEFILLMVSFMNVSVESRTCCALSLALEAYDEMAFS